MLGAGHGRGWPLSARRACSVPARGVNAVLAEVALIAQRDQARGGRLGDDAPDPGRGQVMHGAGQRSGHPDDVSAGAARQGRKASEPLGSGCGSWAIASSTRGSVMPQGDTPYLIRTYAPRSQDKDENASYRLYPALNRRPSSTPPSRACPGNPGPMQHPGRARSQSALHQRRMSHSTGAAQSSMRLPH